jgi:hypothetical protein
MGAYKKLNKQDAYITTYVAHKPWAINNTQYGSYGITVTSANTTTNSRYRNSINQLYYPSKSLSSGNIVSHSFDYYEQTTLFNTAYRTRATEEVSPRIVSIPRALYGTAIQPNTFNMFCRLSTNVFKTILDDGEGGLYIPADQLLDTPEQYVGDIIYPHGIAIITEVAYASSVIQRVSFNSSQPIYTYNYHCKVRESEYNYTYNPSALSGSLKTIYDNNGDVYSTSGNVSDGVLKNNVTGSSFQPYITTVGLYNDANELIAVAKMGQPVPKPANTEMTIIVKIDI